MNYIHNLNGKQLKMDEQEFNKKCDDYISINKFNKNKSINDSSD